MKEIVEFVKARVDEDEAAALAANGPEWTTPGDDGPAEGMLYASDGRTLPDGRPDGGWSIAQFKMYPNGIANSPDSPSYLPAFSTMPVHHIANGIHAARHDPARVLREVAAKRALLETWESVKGAAYPDFDGGYSTATDDAVTALAAVYADHPDYRQEWNR